MEVLIHEASNRQEISASAPTCTVDLKSASKAKREDVDEASEITRKNDKKSIDIIFENITYTVNLGFRKGTFHFFLSDKDTLLKQTCLS